MLHGIAESGRRSWSVIFKDSLRSSIFRYAVYIIIVLLHGVNINYYHSITACGDRGVGRDGQGVGLLIQWVLPSWVRVPHAPWLSLPVIR